MLKIGIYYICTGPYKGWFPGFLESLKNFLPGDEKHLKIISDGLDDYHDYYDDKHRIYVDSIDKIHNYPWPIVTLFKFKYILDNKDDSFDYCFYFNGNSEILVKSNLFWDNFRTILAKNDLLVTYHASDAIIDDIQNFKKGDKKIDKKNSSSYIGTANYIYVQACFWGGKATAIYQMCHEHLNLVSKDLLNHIIAPWDDETYYNKYIYINPDHLKIKYMMCFYAQEIGCIDKYKDEVFALLRNNDNFKSVKVRQTGEPKSFWGEIWNKFIR
ncbi:hypothetical protein [Prevotella melaninogenica]|jgi:hypothetical protein|uniref:hypothetical protein n=1 Tax=Prevotella melaninogenica TaxID=28132 RepID=UPI001C5EA124|nr:hypothetical protein [Prevotella melaninogenica]MBW4730052.1 hypothetical protein [Prevotella melaninogenica]MBW4732745.1 hypothetical protein [Prevotella melaninogenica]MBW4749829.1 hypothetical protein [Prevotella melaninogenica]